MILWNDQIKERESIVVDIEDRGYQFGDGVYEVVRFYDRVTYQMDEHLERLERSAQAIGITLPYDITVLKEKIATLIEASEEATGNVYIQVTRGVAPRIHHFPVNTPATVVGYVMPFDRPLANLQNGIKTITTKDIRWERCDIKSINLLGSVLAKQEAKSQGCDEAIMYRERTGLVTEGSSTNTFIVKDGVIYTHPADNFILNGITRLTVIELAKALHIPIQESAFSLEDLKEADEVFMTSTTSEVTPIIQVDDIVYQDGKPGELTKQLQEAFTQALAKITPTVTP